MLRSLCIFIILEYCFAVQHKDVLIDTGIVRGYMENEGSSEYYAYRGIPYAGAPTETHRFKAPFPPPPWDGIFLANRSVECSQNTSDIEDCLALNVFTPTRRRDILVSVLVYIHGGSFVAGPGPYRRFEPLIKENIIVVSINYRLGFLGFLCLGIEEAPGNAGLKDQTEALKWVQRNIQSFGGDPSRVTLYGESAGGASVEYHVLSKMSTGLFQAAIVESGSALNPWVTNENPIQTALDFAKTLHLPTEITNNLNDFVHYLQHEAASKLSSHVYRNYALKPYGFTPCVERRLHGARAFITKSPHEILAKREYTKVPVVFIFSTFEGKLFASDEINKKSLEEDFLEYMPADLVFQSDTIERDVGETIRRFYFGDKSQDNVNLKIGYFNYKGDHQFVHGVLSSAEMHARDGNPVYLMEFALNAPGHAGFIFYHVNSHYSQDKVHERARKLIANFVKFGNPTPAPTQLLPVTWPRVKPGNLSFLRMDREFTVQRLKDSPYWARKQLWDILYNKYRRQIRPVHPNIVK